MVRSEPSQSLRGSCGYTVAVVEQLAGAVDDRHLDAGADAGIEPHRDALAGRRREQQIVQVPSEDADRFRLGLLAQPAPRRRARGPEHLDLPRPADRFGQPRVGGAAAVLDTGTRRDAPLGNRRTNAVRFIRQHDGEAKEAFVAAAEQREGAMRRHLADGLGGIEVVRELCALVLLARHHGGLPLTAFPQQGPQPADQLRVLGERLHQDPARAFERGASVGDPLLRIDESGGFALGRERRVLQQAKRQRLEARFPRNLRLRPPFRLERQVEIFEP